MDTSLFVQLFDALGARFYPFSVNQTNPLEIRVFALGFGKIVVSAEEMPFAGDDGSFAADGTGTHT